MIGVISSTVAALVGGCGGTSCPPEPPDAAGADAHRDGGGSDTPRDGQSDATPGRCDPIPPCLELARECALALPCTVQSSPTGYAACFSNGVKWILSTDATAKLITIRFLRGDGSTCATETLDPLDGGGGNSVTYSDPSGATFATGTQTSSGALTIACGGQTYNLDFSGCAADGGSFSPTKDCQTGVCQ